MSLSPSEQSVVSSVLQGTVQTIPSPYWSRVRWTTTYSAPTFSISANQLKKAFAYAQGGDMAPGIGTTGNTATAADTNLTAQSQTVGGQSLLIRGVGIQLLQWSDPVLAKLLDPVTSVALVMNGTQRTFLGIPSMLPGGSGWYGRAESQIVTPSLLEQIEPMCGAFTNGFPVIDNYWKFAEPIVWLAAGRRDSMLNIELNNYSVVTNYNNYASNSRTVAEPETTTFSGTNAYIVPGTGGASTFTQGATASSGVVVDFLVILYGVPFQPESSN